MKKSKKMAVVAMGGNALLREAQLGTIEEQEQNTMDTLENLIFLIREGYELVLSHGNGPQVGNILLRNDAGESMYGIPPMPLDICVADSQGGIGFMIERMLRNILIKYHIKKEVITLVTQVVVDQNDPAFSNPVKRIGRTCTQEEARRIGEEKSWIFREEERTKEGWRRVVPSPDPVSVMNSGIVKELALAGNIVIAAGGGGIPVYIDEKENIRTAEAVIDKDLASSLLATSIGADEFYILTDVPFVYLNYNTPQQEAREFLNYADTLKYLQEGQFSEGSMKPKILASLRFIGGGGSKSVITEAFKLEDRSYGTKITMDYDK